LVEISLYPSAKDVPYQKDPDSRVYTGSFGAVHKANSSTGHKAYAVKEIHADQDTVRKSIEAEIQLLRHCDHINVLKLVDAYRVQTIENTFFLVTEPWAPMTLRRFLDELSYDGQTSPCLWWNTAQDLVARDICQGLIDGLAYLHKNNIKHKDIKPENLLLHQSNPHSPIVQPIIADFGISKIYEPGGKTAYTNATVDYLAPEQIKHIESGLKADIFSVGCRFLLMLGAACDGGRGVRKIEDAVTQLPASCQYGRELKRITPVLDSLVASGRGYTGLLGFVVRYMLNEDPQNRPEAKEVQRLIISKPEDWLSLVGLQGRINECLQSLIMHFRNPVILDPTILLFSISTPCRASQ
jgi:serine/threonine protein kinase